MPRPPSSRTAWNVALAGLAALGVAMGVGRFAFTPILPMMQEDAGLTMSGGAWLASANYLGYLAGALLAIRLPVRPAAAVRLSLAITALSTLAMGFAGGFAWWAALRFAAGVASAWTLVFVSSWALEQLSRLGRPELGGWVYAGVGVGISVAGLVCLLLLVCGASSATAWITLGGISLVFTAALWRGVAAQAGAAPAGAAGNELAPGDYWTLVLCYGTFGFGYIIPATFLPAMAKQVVAGPMSFGWVWPIFGLAAALSTLLASRAGQRLGQRRVWIAANMIMAAGLVVPLVIPGLAGIMAAALCVGGTFVVTTMAGLQEARRMAGEHARPLIAAMTSAFAAGQIAGPPAAALVVESTGNFSAALVLAAALLILCSLVLWRGTWKTIDGRPGASASRSGCRRSI